MASRYWVGGGSSTNWNATGNTNWAATSGGSNNETVPGSSDDVFFDGNSGSGDSVISASINIKSLDCNGYIGTITHNTSVTLTISGSGVVYRLSSGMTYTVTTASSSQTLFSGTSSTTDITTNGKVLGRTIFNGAGGTWRLLDAFNNNEQFTLTAGTFNANNFNVNINTLISNSGATRILTMGSGTWTITPAASSFANISTTGLTLNANTSTLKLVINTSTGYLFTGGGATYNNIWITGTSTGIASIASSNTFNNFKVDGEPRTVNFTTGTTQTISSLTATGTVGNLITLQTASAGFTWTLSKSSGVVTCDYLSLRDSIATGGATFNAGAHSTNLGGNSGWTFGYVGNFLSFL